METKMLRWTAGVTRLDHVRNVSVRQRFGVAPIADKLREARLRWYGHVLRADGDTVRKIGLNIDVPGKRPKGRPRQRWLDTLHVDLKEAGIHPDQAFDRAKWRLGTLLMLDAAPMMKNRAETQNTCLCVRDGDALMAHFASALTPSVSAPSVSFTE
ncbi:unnamed protein product [Heligmosomoides polygyrus]|uniref:Integrase n=1 Tax=Heligmosomoides polygyrus TaxID=6339 RepID=A0A183FT27_HELPZ|nr:unnamed protein product [Heligmosomoides polygyrus]